MTDPTTHHPGGPAGIGRVLFNSERNFHNAVEAYVDATGAASEARTKLSTCEDERDQLRAQLAQAEGEAAAADMLAMMATGALNEFFSVDDPDLKAKAQRAAAVLAAAKAWAYESRDDGPIFLTLTERRLIAAVREWQAGQA